MIKSWRGIYKRLNEKYYNFGIDDSDIVNN